MANPNGKVEMRLKEVNVKILGATDEVLDALAFQIEGLTKRNITTNGQVDTGMMRSTVYAVSKKRSSYSQARSEAMGHTFSVKQHRTIGIGAGDIAPERSLRAGDAAAVGVAAEYAIFQEMRIPFLFPAGVEGAKQAGGVANPIYQAKVRD